MLSPHLKSIFALCLALVLLLLGTAGCQEHPVEALGAEESALAARSVEGGEDAAKSMGDGMLDLALCAPDGHTFTLEIDNPYFPLPVGRQWILEGEEDGEDLRVRITVFDETETVSGVTTRVVEEREWEDDELIEVSRNFFAQTEAGTVCYFGEDVDIYEDGEVVSHDGAWRADEPGHAPGIFMPAKPKIGMRYQLEVAPGIAEDEVEVLSFGLQRVILGPFRDVTGILGGSPPLGRTRAPGIHRTVPAGVFPTLRILESNPLDGDAGEKVFARGLGLIVDEALTFVGHDDDGEDDDGEDDDGEDDDEEDDDEEDDDEEDDDEEDDDEEDDDEEDDDEEDDDEEDDDEGN